jgi:hypothetical protein
VYEGQVPSRWMPETTLQPRQARVHSSPCHAAGRILAALLRPSVPPVAMSAADACPLDQAPAHR